MKSALKNLSLAFTLSLPSLIHGTPTERLLNALNTTQVLTPLILNDITRAQRPHFPLSAIKEPWFELITKSTAAEFANLSSALENQWKNSKNATAEKALLMQFSLEHLAYMINRSTKENATALCNQIKNLVGFISNTFAPALPSPLTAETLYPSLGIQAPNNVLFLSLLASNKLKDLSKDLSACDLRTSVGALSSFHHSAISGITEEGDGLKWQGTHRDRISNTEKLLKAYLSFHREKTGATFDPSDKSSHI